MTTIEIQAFDISEKRFYEELIDINEPRICNHCHNSGEQIFISGILSSTVNEDFDAIACFKCYYCEAITIHFLNEFQKFDEDGFYNCQIYDVTDSYPRRDEPHTLDLTNNQLIKNNFKEFFDIYNQAAECETYNLDKVAGMGYRKSLEFLITDFLLQYPPNGVTQEWLTNPKTSLGSKIDQLSNERIKKLAKASSFIGNDETHYTRRHPEYDTKSIKMFIKALLSDIENEISLLEAENILNKPK